MASGHGANLERVDASHLPSDNNRHTQSTEGHRCGVGDQAQPCGVQRIETQPHKQGTGDRHWRAEAGRTFEESPEGEADQQYLQALVIGDREHRAANHLELTALDRKLVEEYGRDNDPGDWPQTIGEAVTGSGKGHVQGHVVGQSGD
ncbi:hypothetical protein D3C78_1166850 [compost metagenome]